MRVIIYSNLKFCTSSYKIFHVKSKSFKNSIIFLIPSCASIYHQVHSQFQELRLKIDLHTFHAHKAACVYCSLIPFHIPLSFLFFFSFFSVLSLTTTTKKARKCLLRTRVNNVKAAQMNGRTKTSQV